MSSSDNHSEKKKVLSASRRTDIPAFYLEWFMAGIAEGAFQVVNPYNRRVTSVDVRPVLVHSIVFWSKNFGPLLDSDCLDLLGKGGYPLFFNFTVNGSPSVLEPNLSSLAKRLDQMKRLCRRCDPGVVNWRFDPVCHFIDSRGRAKDNLDAFSAIADAAAAAGIQRCITSFMDDYTKIRRRTALLAPFAFFDPAPARKVEILLGMEERLASRNIQLFTCCEKDVMTRLPASSTIRPSACIPGDLLVSLFGSGISTGPDRGQRRSQGCGCSPSVDIGSYSLHPCYHNCLFCYANPSSPPAAEREPRQRH